ncbi:exonuclease SbcC [Paenibacillus sp. 1182]|uniref:metallophosphoesterase n=1 Tax=Paenibacillus sp. 1182 TaxID=2806565 RepID=UPI001AE1CE27|nr:metallophosphoesterase [Paenibacillus sp. 1182]MBP1308707.1 exonuclease SbcC [Paenibacillus sp. 1182]
MRLLYFGDKHERVTAPENRMDEDYGLTQRRKTMEIIEIGKKLGVSGFLQPGDFLDGPSPPFEYVADVMSLWTGDDVNKELEKLENKMPPLIGIVGNHELYGNNLKTLPKTMIGFLNRLGLMRFATKEKPYFFTTEDGATVAVTGTHYHLDIDSPEYIDDYIVEEKLGDFHIHMVHGYLTDKSKGDMFRHTLIDHIKHTKADVTISGHDHIGFPLTNIDGKWFVNPGAIPRMSNDLKEMKRKPKVLLMDITKAHGIRFKEYFLKSAQQGDLVLNRDKIVERVQREGRIAQLKKTVRDVGLTKSTDIIEIIRDLADTDEVPREIRDDVIDRVSKKKSEISENFEETLKDAVVVRAIFENFQSHEYTDLEFSRGLNVLVGESRQGKTAILRGFQWMYENKPSGRRVIKRGAGYAKITFFLSNGFIVSRIMEKKKNGRNGYEITDPSTGEVVYYNTKILPEVQKILGYNPFVIDKDLQFNLNSMKQGTGWFLIGDHFSAPLKAKIIGAIYGTHYADAVTRELEAEDRKVNDELKRTQADVQKLDEKIKQYEHLNDLENIISQVEVLLQQIDQWTDRKDRIVATLEKRRGMEVVVHENDEIIAKLSSIEEIALMFERVKIQHVKHKQLSSSIEKRTSLQNRYNLLEESLYALRDTHQAERLFATILNTHKQSLGIKQLVTKRQQTIALIQDEDKIIHATTHIEEAYKLLEEMKTGFNRRDVLQEKSERAKRLVLSRNEVARKLSYIQETLDQTAEIETARQLIDNFTEKVTRSSNIKKEMVIRRKIQDQLSAEDRVIEKQSKETAVLVGNYQTLLEEAGSCPVCHGTIDKVTVSRIVGQYAAASSY